MKAKTKRAARLPRARVMHATPDIELIDKQPISRLVQGNWMFCGQPVAVIPCRNREQARAWVRLAGMSEDKRLRLVVRTADKLTYGNYWNIDCARADLRAQLTAAQTAEREARELLGECHPLVEIAVKTAAQIKHVCKEATIEHDERASLLARIRAHLARGGGEKNSP